MFLVLTLLDDSSHAALLWCSGQLTAPVSRAGVVDEVVPFVACVLLSCSDSRYALQRSEDVVSSLHFANDPTTIITPATACQATQQHKTLQQARSGIMTENGIQAGLTSLGKGCLPCLLAHQDRAGLP